MRITKSPVVVSAFFLLMCSLPVLAQANWIVVKTLPIGGEGGWDYLTVDPQTHQLYVPRSTHTMVIDSESARLSPTFPVRSERTALLLFELVKCDSLDSCGSGLVAFESIAHYLLPSSMRRLSQIGFRPKTFPKMVYPSSGTVKAAALIPHRFHKLEMNL